MLSAMIKGTDYTGINLTFFCHDGKGNYLMHQRTGKCRDEHWAWDFGGGGLKFGETLEEGLRREVREEYGIEPIKVEFLGFREIHRVHEGKATHWIAFDFKVAVDREKVVIGEPEKMAEIGWYTLDVLPEPMHSQLLTTINKNRQHLI